MQAQTVQVKYLKVNKRARINQKIFALTLIVYQGVLSVLYGLFCQAPVQTANLNSVLTAIFLAFLVIGGFGLYFSYFKNLIWSGLAFSLLITALSIQMYPLVNALWAKLNIHNNRIFSDSFSKKNFTLFIAAMDSINYQTVKCALALIVSFGSVIGRIGPLECLLMTVFGVLTYELNRNVIANFAQDAFGTFSVFTFGGFSGITFGMFLAIREKKKGVITYKHPQLNGGAESTAHSIFGGILIFVLFPFLAFEGDQSYASNLFGRYNTPASIILSMSSAIITSVGVGMLVHGDKQQSLRIKDVLNGLLAGGIVNGAASFYITTPFLAVAIAVPAAILQYLFDNVMEKRLCRGFGLLSTHSFTVFCLQGLVGAIFAAGYNTKISASTPSNGFVFAASSLQGPGYEIVIYLISAGFGIACGIVSGIPCYFINRYKTDDLFHDRVQFKTDDSIYYETRRQREEIIQTKPSKDQKIEEVVLHDRATIQNGVGPAPQSEQLQSAPSQFTQIQFDFVDMLQVPIQ